MAYDHFLMYSYMLYVVVLIGYMDQNHYHAKLEELTNYVICSEKEADMLQRKIKDEHFLFGFQSMTSYHYETQLKQEIVYHKTALFYFLEHWKPIPQYSQVQKLLWERQSILKALRRYHLGSKSSSY